MSTRTAKGVSQHYFTEANPPLRVGEQDKLFTYVYLDPNNPPKTIMLQWNDGTWEHRAFWGEDLIAFGSGAQSPNHLHLGPLPKTGEWVRLEVEAEKVGLPGGTAINGWAYTQFDGRTYWDKSGIVTRSPQAGNGFDSLAKWDAYERSQSKSSLPDPIKPLDQGRTRKAHRRSEEASPRLFPPKDLSQDAAGIRSVRKTDRRLRQTEKRPRRQDPGQHGHGRYAQAARHFRA